MTPFLPASTDCSRFEIAIDQRLRGALAADETDALEAHCLACESCRTYEESARNLERELHAVAEAARGDVDWSRFERDLRAALRARVRKFVAGIVLGIVAITLATWGFAPPGKIAPFALELSAIVGTILLVRNFRSFREARRVSSLSHGAELFARYRSMLEKQARTIRTYRWGALAVALWCLSNAIRATELRHVVVHVGLAAIVAGSWLYTLLVSYPRLHRELVEFGAAPKR